MGSVERASSSPSSWRLRYARLKPALGQRFLTEPTFRLSPFTLLYCTTGIAYTLACPQLIAGSRNTFWFIFARRVCESDGIVTGGIAGESQTTQVAKAGQCR